MRAIMRGLTNTTHRGTPRSGFVVISALLVFLFSPALSASSPRTVVLVYSSGVSAYQRAAGMISDGISRYCQDTQPGCQVRSGEVGSIDFNALAVDSSVIVALGSSAADAVLANDRLTDTPSLIAMLSRINAETLEARYRAHSRLSFLYLDQPAERILTLARLVSRNGEPAGMLISANTQRLIPEYRSAAKRLSMAEPVTARVDSRSELGPKLNQLLDSSGVLIALPDAQIYNRQTLVNLLLGSYRKRVPVIGFSAAFSRAGALVSLYTSPQQVAQQASSAVMEMLKSPNKKPPRLVPPKLFSLKINRSVASSLGITLSSEEELAKRVEGALK